METLQETKHTSMHDRLVKLCFKVMGLNRPFSSKAKAAHFFEQRRNANRQRLKLPGMISKRELELIAGFPVYTINAEYDFQTAILYLHGGSYVYQPLAFHWWTLDQISRAAKLPFIVPIYPKAPEHHFDKAYDYLEQVYLEAKAKYRHIILMGDSAGGGFALGFAQHCQHQGFPQPDKLILISPWVDLTMTNPEIQKYEKADVFLSTPKLRRMGEAWAGGTRLTDYRLSPLYGNLENLPPITLFAGTHEVFLPDIRMLKDRLLVVNNTLHYYEKEKMLHVYPILPIPEAKEAQRIIIKELP